MMAATLPTERVAGVPEVVPVAGGGGLSLEVAANVEPVRAWLPAVLGG